MEARGYQPDESWKDPNYRGKKVPSYDKLDAVTLTNPIYPEHQLLYLKECLENLRQKGIFIHLF